MTLPNENPFAATERKIGVHRFGPGWVLRLDLYARDEKALAEAVAALKSDIDRRVADR